MLLLNRNTNLTGLTFIVAAEKLLLWLLVSIKYLKMCHRSRKFFHKEVSVFLLLL